MTAVPYPDLKATSPNGRFLLEARSPHNGTILHRDGRPPTDDEYGFKYGACQDCFRFRLIRLGDEAAPGTDEPRGHVVWERWQSKEEDSPKGLTVSDDGWSILYPQHSRPEVIVMSPQGAEVLRVRLIDSEYDSAERWAESAANVYVWRTPLSITSAGRYWRGDAEVYFMEGGESGYFVLRRSAGQRLIIDLARAVVQEEAELGRPTQGAAFREDESRWAHARLLEWTERLGDLEKPISEGKDGSQERSKAWATFLQAMRVDYFIPFQLVAFYRLRECIPLLRRWEAVDAPGHASPTISLGLNWWIEKQLFRPIVQLALRRMGEAPEGYSTFHFVNDWKERLPIPERIPDRRQAAAGVRCGMDAAKVLQLIGSPDDAYRRSLEIDNDEVEAWREVWDYAFLKKDGGWTTLQLQWAPGGGEEHGRLERIAYTSPHWLQDRWLQAVERAW